MAPGQRGLPTPIFDALIAGSLVSAGYTEISISPGFSIRGFDATLVAPPPPPVGQIPLPASGLLALGGLATLQTPRKRRGFVSTAPEQSFRKR